MALIVNCILCIADESTGFWLTVRDPLYALGAVRQGRLRFLSLRVIALRFFIILDRTYSGAAPRLW